MSFRERVLLGIIASGLTLAMFAPSCDPKPTPEACARKLGIAYSVEEGAVDQLDKFQSCVEGR
jgi:hypothetical protein